MIMISYLILSDRYST